MCVWQMEYMHWFHCLKIWCETIWSLGSLFYKDCCGPYGFKSDIQKPNRKDDAQNHHSNCQLWSARSLHHSPIVGHLDIGSLKDSILNFHPEFFGEDFSFPLEDSTKNLKFQNPGMKLSISDIWHETCGGYVRTDWVRTFVRIIVEGFLQGFLRIGTLIIFEVPRFAMKIERYLWKPYTPSKTTIDTKHMFFF